jgi:hypothetical protein
MLDIGHAVKHALAARVIPSMTGGHDAAGNNVGFHS